MNPSQSRRPVEQAPRRVRDVLWDRILFQPPSLNPRMVFDPVPFRTQALLRPAFNRPAGR